MSADAVTYPSLKDAAAASLREQILTGKLVPGTKVDQDEISNWWEISARHHARILSALEAHDAHEAQRMLEHHVAESGDLAVEILQEMGYWDREAAEPVEATEPGAA